VSPRAKVKTNPLTVALVRLICERLETTHLFFPFQTTNMAERAKQVGAKWKSPFFAIGSTSGRTRMRSCRKSCQITCRYTSAINVGLITHQSTTAQWHLGTLSHPPTGRSSIIPGSVPGPLRRWPKTYTGYQRLFRALIALTHEKGRVGGPVTVSVNIRQSLPYLG
jgi:hypothetical protein